MSYVQGRRDPTAVHSRGRVVRVTLGAQGPVVHDLSEQADGSVLLRSSNENAGVLIDQHPLLGDSDPGHDVAPVHPAVQSAMAAVGELKLAVTNTPYHDLLPAVLGQRVTGREAARQWEWLCTTHGEPVRHLGHLLHAPPTPDALLSIPYHEFHRAGVERRRAETLRNIALHGERLITGWMVDRTVPERTESLQLIPGVGPWTAAVAGHTCFGDADALEVGDFHAKNTVVYALTGRHRGTDSEMCELLAPYVGHRQRVLRWLRLTGIHAPAHGPRRRIVSIARL